MLLCVIIIIIGLLLCYYIYLDIESRDKVNFDELNLGNPSLLSPNDIARKQQSAGKNGDLLGSINLGYCVGAACCCDASGTVWDSNQSMCVVKPSVISDSHATDTPVPLTTVGSMISASTSTSSTGSTLLGTTVPGLTVPKNISAFTTIKQAYQKGDLVIQANPYYKKQTTSLW